MRELSITIDRSVEKALIGKAVQREHVSNMVEPGTVLRGPDGKALVVFGKLGGVYDGIKALLPGMPYTANDRLTRRNNDYANIKAKDLQFGFKPKRPVFNLPASACKMNSTRPAEYAKLVAFGQEMMGLYKEWSPEFYERQIGLMAGVADHWKLPDTFFTQGIINDTVNLDFHYDRGNITGCWSAMGVFLRDVKGGELVLPALGLSLAIADQTYVLFDGQSLLHGVAPISKVGHYGRRFSIVYYAHAAMRSCGTFNEELEKMRQVDLRKHRKNVEKR